MSDSQRHILTYGTDGTFPSCRKGFSGSRNGFFEVTGGCVPACMKGVLESRNGLFRATETAGARSERIHIRFFIHHKCLRASCFPILLCKDFLLPELHIHAFRYPPRIFHPLLPSSTSSSQYIRKILRLPSPTVQLMLLVVTLQIFIPCVSRAIHCNIRMR